MKLRNKTTGEIVECPMIRVSIGVCNLMRYEFPSSIAKLNEEWEDYKPAEPKEPLIKDEKIRKAIRAWAEAIGVSRAVTAHPNFDTTTLAGLRDPYRQISFPNERAYLPECKVYTIAELCGEEEE